MAYDIFISYRRDGGSDFARKLQLALTNRKYNYNVFLDVDELKYGKFDHRILEAIDSAPIFMLVLSPHALDRCVNEDDWVRKEIEYALQKKRHIIPVNPDKLFKEFPAEFPEELKAGFGLHNFAEVMFDGQAFWPTVEQLVKGYIEPIILEPPQRVGALYHVETDTECRIMKFGEEIAVARPGEHLTIRLRKGRHKLEIVSTECPDDWQSIIYTVEDNDMEDFIEIKLLPVREKRLQAERAERERREAERKAEERRRAAEEAAREAETLNAKADKAYDAGNYTEAASLYRKAAELGNADAQNSLGSCYSGGKGVKQDYTEAVKWYRKAAEQGNSSAQYNLGICYYYGRGVEKDEAEAVKWYRKVAELENLDDQYSLGYRYQFGKGVKQDYTEAAKCYRKAAEKGYGKAQIRLGNFYENGKGVKQDYMEAIICYQKGADNGDLFAKAALAKLEK